MAQGEHDVITYLLQCVPVAFIMCLPLKTLCFTFLQVCEKGLRLYEFTSLVSLSNLLQSEIKFSGHFSVVVSLASFQLSKTVKAHLVDLAGTHPLHIFSIVEAEETIRPCTLWLFHCTTRSHTEL